MPTFFPKKKTENMNYKMIELSILMEVSIGISNRHHCMRGSPFIILSLRRFANHSVYGAHRRKIESWMVHRQDGRQR